MSEMSWRKEPVQNITEWISQYLSRRYGVFNEHALKAWTILSEKVLNSNGDHFNQKVLLVTMPKLDKTDFVWYPISDIAYAWDHMVSAIPDLQHEEGFK